MKKSLLIAAGTAAMLFALTAQAAPKSTEDAIFAMNDGTEREVETIDIKENGDFSYKEASKSGDAQPTLTMKKSKVRWAWVRKPKAIRATDKDFKKGEFKTAVAEYAQHAEKYAKLSWEPYCKVKQAECLMKLNKNKEAVAVLETLVNYPTINRKNEGEVMDAYSMLTSEYIKGGMLDKAVPLLDLMVNSEKADVACPAFILKGDMLYAKAEKSGKRDDYKTAAMAYFQAALLFPDSTRAPEAVLKSYKSLKAIKDARAQKFAEIMKTKYPRSQEASQLK